MTDDEKLSGYVDNELAAPDRAAMSARLADDPVAQSRLSQLRETDEMVRAAYDGTIRQDIPDRFLAAVDKGIAAHTAGAQLAVVASPAGNDNRPRRWLVGGAMAASLAVGFFLRPQLVSGRDDSGIASAAFAGALGSTPSLQTASFASGERLTPSLSFAKRGGGYCRQFDLIAGGQKSTGVACTKNGTWTIEAILPSAKVTPSDGYTTAEGPESPGMATIIDSIRKGDPLDQTAERRIIAQNWK